MCGAPGASVGANARQWGVESRQGAENSALKNIAPFNRTPFNTSGNASTSSRFSGRPAKYGGARAKHSKATGLAGTNFNRGHGQRTGEPTEPLAPRDVVQSKAAHRKTETLRNQQVFAEDFAECRVRQLVS